MFAILSNSEGGVLGDILPGAGVYGRGGKGREGVRGPALTKLARGTTRLNFHPPV